MAFYLFYFEMVNHFGEFDSDFFVVEIGDKVGAFAGEIFKLNFGKMMKKRIQQKDFGFLFILVSVVKLGVVDLPMIALDRLFFQVAVQVVKR